MTTRDDGRGLTGRRLAAFYHAGALALIRIDPAQDAKMTVSGAVLTDRDQAYQLAFAIMQRADDTWPRS